VTRADAPPSPSWCAAVGDEGGGLLDILDSMVRSI
jgi:hypothetical protein